MEGGGSPSIKAAEAYLAPLLNKTFRIHTTDKRMFLGEFKCTDSDQNIILAKAFEYRLPPPSREPTVQEIEEKGKVWMDLSSRYLGLVVVPGWAIDKIEIEEFKSQVRTRQVIDWGSGGES